VFDEWDTLVEAIGEVDGREVRVSFSRIAGIVIEDREFQMVPPDLLEQTNVHAVLRRIEVEHGMGVPMDTPLTNGVTTAYRAIAWILNAMVNSRYSWTLLGERASDPAVTTNIDWMERGFRMA